jgi:serine/threonine-protein kinase
LNPDVPADLDAIAMKSLAKNPDNRYSSATEMREDLERFTAGQRVHATPLLGETMAATAVGSGTQVMRQTEVFSGQDDEPGRSRAGWYVVIALLILGLFGLVAYLIATNALGGGELKKVPDVVGLTEDEASDELEAAGFKVEPEERPSRKEEGEVIKQDPKAGDRLEEGETVTITVSTGARQVEVPDVEGMQLPEATETLEDAGLKVGEVTRVESEEEPGTVLDQSPAAETEVDVDSEVSLDVAESPVVIVPDVINQSQESATEELERLGLVAVVDTAPSNEVDEGNVIAQEPEPGTEAEAGDEVVILVSEGPEAQSMPSVIGQDGGEAEALLESEPYLLDVTVEETVCPGAVPPGEVCEQDPAEGTEVEAGDSATLFVQEGSASLGAPFALIALIFGSFYA